METKRRSPLPAQAHQCGSSILRRGGEESGHIEEALPQWRWGTPDGVERNSERERRRRPEPGPSGVHSPLWQPLLGTALSRSGPEVFRLRQACPRSSGEGPGQHPRVSGPPGAPALLRDPNRRVGIVAVSLLLGRCRLFVLGHGLRGERSSDPSSGRVPPGPPRPPTDGATVLSPQFHKAGTPLGVAPIRRRTAPTSRCHPGASLAVCPFGRRGSLRAFADTPALCPSPLAFTTPRGVAAGQSRSTGATASSVICVSPVSAVAVHHLGPQRLYAA
ncbi:hypothetical protein NDU88_001461 [Pleurodeles waltl]|uniref:Uncharacterized protein n=1 Tax=Pleurodeles waltl TaxID=8319 RepID=A0AAV7WIH8_PLEWA|nr:hypothetical protein NDU88_001461 [Pleurodeles waltl]